MKKVMKKMLALFLSAAMICSGMTIPAAAETLWDGEVITAVAENEDSYQISEAAELAWVAQQVNNGNSFAGKTIELVSDINLNDQPWTPIGTITVESGSLTEVGTAFEGTFDGGDHTISGLNAVNENGGVALFGHATGTIKNLTLSGTVTGGSYTGGLIAYGCGTISGVTNNADVFVGAESNYVGGILGEASGDVVITDCHNNAQVTNGGGAAEKSTGRIGGIVGRIESGNSTIQNCSNTGDITGYQYVSGIIGGCFANVTIKGCYNTGTLTGISFGKVYVGGIAGKLHGGSIDSCYNWGDINITPWNTGNIRAVGGIAGCEENHDVGTAITNCYNAGTIELDTSKMSGSKRIYLVGGISGGNNSDGNTMSYEDCFYLEGCIPCQYPEHESYEWWNDMYKEDPLLYDTDMVTSCTLYELKDGSLLDALGGYFKANSAGGYPVLYWQDGSEAPDLQFYDIKTSVSGGTAVINIEKSAEETSEVSFTISDIEEGKQVKSVKVKDISGSEVPLTEKDGNYIFTMPSRIVTVSVVLENIVAGDAAAYQITLPADLDPIWNIQVESSQYDEAAGTILSGATATVIVKKEEGAMTSSFTGIAVTTEDGTTIEVTEANEKEKSGSQYYGEYSFTMPEKNVVVSVEIVYKAFDVYVETDGTTELIASYTREQMENFSQENNPTYYSGWSTETEPFIGIADEYITLDQILAASGVTFEKGDALKITGVDNFIQTFTYDYLIGTERKYYSDILQNGTEASEGTAFSPAFILKGNMAVTEEEKETLVCDTLNAYRFAFGQSEDELKNAVKITDSMAKSLVSITIMKSELQVDTSWYRAEDQEFTIATAAQLRGLAAIVNGTAKEAAQDNFEGKTIVLANDIALDEDGKYSSYENVSYGTESWPVVVTQYVLSEDAVIWTPIGSGTATSNVNATTDHAFAGTFDGQGHSISGIYTGTKDRTEANTETVQGLFGVVTGTIKNVTVSGCITAKMVAGGIAAHLEGGTIENCVNHAIVFTDGGTTPEGSLENGINGAGAAGGIVGNAADGSSVTDCVNDAAVTCANTNLGGRTGGIIGLIDNSSYAVSISRNINKGRIDSYQYAGGIVGGNWSQAAPIDNCVNMGYVTSHSSGMSHSGGIVSWSNSNISNCYNSGDVKVIINNGKDKASHIGGIVADFAGTEITNCYNVGEVSFGGTATFATSYGGICGTGYGMTTESTKLINCYMLEGTEGENAGYADTVTSDELKTAAMVQTLGEAYTADNDETPVNNGYPVLKWQYDYDGEEEETALTIISQPVDYAGKAGETATFEVEATGKGLTYQWQYSNNGSKWYNSGMMGNTTGTLRVPVTNGRNGQQYRCVITDASGNQLISDAAVLCVKQSDLQITVQPEDYEGAVGTVAVFEVEAAGEGLTYQWQYSNNGSKWYHSGMTGADTAVLSVAVTKGRNGQQYRCVITDASGNQLTSDAAVLCVKQSDLQITVQPEDYEGAVGTVAVFEVEAAGEGLTYQWQYSNNGSKWYNSGMTGADTASLSVAVTNGRNGQQYRCVVTDGTGSQAISNTVKIVVCEE